MSFIKQGGAKPAAGKAGGGGGGPDLLRLQRKIFTRWVNQKLARKHITVNDIVADIGDSNLLITLMEVLSDKKFSGKLEKNPRMRVQKIDNINSALSFVWSCGVQTKVKPSAENLVDGDERSVLGLVWAIMSQYLKIVDENGQQLDAKSALLEWCQAKTGSYPEVKIDNFSSFNDGLALCAIIHKHRPHMIDWEHLPKDDKKQCLQTAMDAAYEYFGLEKYLLPEDIPRLDENSILIYVSEYYYGIGQQRKLDLAANRIAKLIKTTKTNDDLKTEYVDKATVLLKSIEEAGKFLTDRTIDDSLSKANKQVDDFYEYKNKEKAVISNQFVNLESLFNNLSVKLVYNKRPSYTPPQGLDLVSIQEKIFHLESLEHDKKVFLLEELNRQVKLSKADQQHLSKYKKLIAWLEDKEKYLRNKEQLESVSAAQLHLRLLDAFEAESARLVSGSVAALKSLGAQLSKENFEGKQTVAEREREVDEFFEKLHGLAKQKRTDLEKDLAREVEKETLRIEFARLANEFTRWAKETAETVDADTDFGFTIDEVKSSLSTIEVSDKSIQSDIDAKTVEYSKVLDTLKKHGVNENPYTTTTATDLVAHTTALKTSLEGRRTRYQEELARQQKSDEISREFAETANRFAKDISEKRSQITAGSGALEDQLLNLESEIAKCGVDQQTTLDDLKTKESQIISRNNSHTTLSYKDVAGQWEQYKEFLEKKKAAVADQLLLSTRKGVTTEQVQEIEESFLKFDEDKDGFIDKKELRQCLYSVGEEREMWEIEEIIAKFGNKELGKIDGAGFKEFMIKVFGDTASKDQVLESLELMAKGDVFVKLENIKSIMNPADLEYFVQTAPRKPDEESVFNYKVWTDEVFSR